MNRFLDLIAELYTPMRLRGMLMDGQYRFVSDNPTPGVPTSDPRASCGSRFSGDPAAAGQTPRQAPIAAGAAPTGARSHRFASFHR